MPMKYYYDRESDEPDGCTSFMRYFLILVSLLLFLASAALIAGGVILKQKNMIGKYCSVCDSMFLYIIISAAVLCGVSLVGLLALCYRNGFLIAVYCTVQLLLFLALLGIVVLIVLFKEGRLDSVFVDVWKGIPNVPKCALQIVNDCSGWDSACTGTAVITNSTMCPACTAADQAKIATFKTTCHQRLLSYLNKWYGVVLGIGIGVTLVCLISAVVGCKLVRGKSSTDNPYLSPINA